MAAFRFPRTSAALLLLVLAAVPASAREPLRDAPVVWHADDRRHVEGELPERDPSLFWDYIGDSFTRPIARATDPTRWVRWLGVPFGGHHAPRAANVNALGEVPNSSWFTNRIGLFPMPVEAARRGPGPGGPSASEPWVITRAKTEGVTPGFTIRDATGVLFLIKFDPPEWPTMATAAGVISQRIFHAAGYHVPDDNIVHFRREDLVLGDARISESGRKRPMTEADVDAILARVRRRPDGTYRAISSRFLSGTPLGPFDFLGRRKQDPNDRVPHEQRRELRGAAVVAAWVGHFDTKQHNTLDMMVEEDGRRYVRHHWIDLASTLGTGARGPVQRIGWEVTFDPKAFLRRNLTLGLTEDDWRRTRRPHGLPEISYFESEHFDPFGYEPLQPNPTFADLTRLDGYWGAKIVSAFTDAHLRAIVEEARYEDPASADHMARVLAARRDKIARAWFGEVTPLDFFTLAGRTLDFHDLAVERGLEPDDARYRVRVFGVDAERDGARPAWETLTETRMDLDPHWDRGAPFLAAEVAVDRGHGFGRSVTCYVAPASGRVVAVDRD